jgi:hypothetical protein
MLELNLEGLKSSQLEYKKVMDIWISSEDLLMYFKTTKESLKENK